MARPFAIVNIGPGAFRVFLACLVVMHHSTAIRYGKFAVYAFFILSGYWVLKLYREHYEHTPWGVAFFWLARLWRIFPCFAVCTTLYLVAYRPHLTVVETVRSFYLLFYNIYSTHLLPPAWSLDVELQFYVLVPLLAVSPLCRASFLLAPLLFIPLDTIWHRIPESILIYSTLFMAGGYLYLYRINVSKVQAGISLAVVAVLAATKFVSNEPTITIAGFQFPDRVIDVAMAICLIPFIAHNVHRTSAHDKILGDLSYMIYVFHWIPIFYLRQRIGYYDGVDFTIGDTPSILLAWAVTAVGSVALLRWIDLPSERLRARVLRLRRLTAPSAQ